MSELVPRDYSRTKTRMYFIQNDPVTDFRGLTSCHTAVLHRNKDALAVILRRGANPDMANDDGESPLHLAVETGEEEVIKGTVQWDFLNFFP